MCHLTSYLVLFFKYIPILAEKKNKKKRGKQKGKRNISLLLYCLLKKKNFSSMNSLCPHHPSQQRSHFFLKSILFSLLFFHYFASISRHLFFFFFFLNLLLFLFYFSKQKEHFMFPSGAESGRGIQHNDSFTYMHTYTCCYYQYVWFKKNVFFFLCVGYGVPCADRFVFVFKALPHNSLFLDCLFFFPFFKSESFVLGD